jgi:beta-phosphoglucomutase-like phosphatase (HAD superfamily)
VKTLDRLVATHKFADRRWEKALKRKGYPADDDAEESALVGKPHTDEEKLCVFWADAWRRLLHAAEDELLKHPQVRRGVVEGLQLREAPTYHDPTVA